MDRLKMWFYPPQHDPSSLAPSKELLGGKGYNLLQLQLAGQNVPCFGILTGHAFEYWQEHRQLPADLINEMKNIMQTWPSPYISVRSSMVHEDSAAHSFAGLFKTLLFISAENLVAAINECFESVQNANVAEYAQKKNLQYETAFAVVIQTMIDADVSGVAFSRSPSQSSALTAIEACRGIGEGLVAGKVEVDSYLLDRWGQIFEENIQEKKLQMRYNGQGLEAVAVPSALQSSSCLSRDELKHLNAQLLKIEEYYHCPIDIEWCYQNQVLYILQARPITQEMPPLEYFIDTNLTESYPGESSELSGHFVQEVYAKVFYEIGNFLNFSTERQKFLAPYYKGLIINLGGHLYYRIKSYYFFLASLPGGKKNIENWHLMIGGNANTQEMNDFKELTQKEKFYFYFNLLKLVIFHPWYFANFYKKTTKIQRKLRKKTKKAVSHFELMKVFDEALKQDQGFALTALNDYLIMISLNLLTKKVQEMGYDERILPVLIKTQKGVESLRPLASLYNLIDQLKKNPKFFPYAKNIVSRYSDACYDLGDKKWDLFFADFKAKKLDEEIDLIKDYLKVFGDRSFEELKLESLTLKQSPDAFFQLLFWEEKNTQRQHLEPHELEENLNESTKKNKQQSKHPLQEIKQRLHQLSWRQQIEFHLNVYLLHRFIATREKTRLVRGRFYGWTRSHFLKIFKSLKKNYPGFFGRYPLKSFFHIGLKSLREFDGSVGSLEHLVEQLNRGEQKKHHTEFPEFMAHVQDSPESPYFIGRKKIYHEKILKDALKGMGASKGEVEGEVIILHHPTEALQIQNLSDKILVTTTTDPAWVFIISQCKGLISEKGSLLSHTAIIGRELGIPTVVAVKEATHLLKKVKRVRINGENGTIKILEYHSPAPVKKSGS